MVTIPKTYLEVHPLCLGANVFGWSASESESFAVLDAYVEAGGNFIDTADVYSEWKDGNTGGESESIIGKWMKARGNRHSMVIATKVAKLSTRPGLSRSNINSALEDSLLRLQTDHIDLYYSHEDDDKTPLTETLSAYTDLISAGKISYVGASNYSGARLLEASQISQQNSLAEYVLLQMEYNLMTRQPFEQGQEGAVIALGLSALPFYGLARGFLSGKYRPGLKVESVRAEGTMGFQTPTGWKIIATVDQIAKNHNCSMSAIALAWLRANDAVSTPIASARTVEQVQEIMQVVTLSGEEIAELNVVSG